MPDLNENELKSIDDRLYKTVSLMLKLFILNLTYLYQA